VDHQHAADDRLSPSSSLPVSSSQQRQNGGLETTTAIASSTGVVTTTATTTAAAPLYITIGPPCAGKSTWIAAAAHRQKEGERQQPITDVCLDDQIGVYHALPCHVFLESGPPDDADDDQVLSQVLFGKTVYDRVHAPNQVELRAVLGRLAGRLTTQDQFERVLTEAAAMANPNNNNTQVVSTLVRMVEEIVAAAAASDETATIALPETVDLYVQEAIYRPMTINTTDDDNGNNVTSSTTALERCRGALHWHASSQPGVALAWGNTNTRPSDYKMALEVAASSHRPVHFVMYRDSELSSASLSSSVLEDDVFDRDSSLAAENLADLLRRNVRRLLHTGRYIPASVVADMRQRTADSINRVVEAWNLEQQRQQQSSSLCNNNSTTTALSNDSNGTTTAIHHDNATSLTGHNRRMTKLEFDQGLARMINFDMRPDRTVVPNSPVANANKRARHEAYNNRTRYQQRQQQPPRPYEPRGSDYYPRRRPWERMGMRDHQNLDPRRDGGRSSQYPGNNSPQRRWNATRPPDNDGSRVNFARHRGGRGGRGYYNDRPPPPQQGSDRNDRPPRESSQQSPDRRY